MSIKVNLLAASLKGLRTGAIVCAVAAAPLMGVLPAAAQTAASAAAQTAPKTPAQVAAEKAAAAFPALTRTQIDALLAKPETLVVLDVRRADELSSIGGFPAYLNIQAADLEHYLAYIPKDHRILTVSNHAHRAQAAAALLASHGFKIAGAAGAQDYEAQGGKLVGQKPPATTAAAPAATSAR